MTAVTDIDKLIGARIKSRRVVKKLSPDDLADILGVKVLQVFRYEAGTTPVKPTTMVEIAKALGVRPTYFMEGL